MARKRHIAAYIGAGIGLGIVLGILLILVMTQTEFGIQRAGRFTVGWLDERIQGELAVGRVTSRGGLLGGITLEDVSITTPDGGRFLQADSIRLSYDWRSFVSGRVVFDAVFLHGADVLLEELPGDTSWNFNRVLEGTAPAGPDAPSPNRLILVGGIEIQDSRVTVRTEWQPDEGEPIEPDDTARIIVDAVPGGLVRVMRFEDIDARIPRVLWESPFEEGHLFEISSLSTRGFVFEDPFLLRDLRGIITLRDSLVSFDLPRVVFPRSDVEAVGRVILTGENSVDARVRGSDVALADLQWLLPDLPDDAVGDLTLRIQSMPAGGTLWLFRDVAISAEGSEIHGTLGFVTGDSLYFTRADLSAEPLNLEMLERLIPGDLPLEGLSVGRVEIGG